MATGKVILCSPIVGSTTHDRVIVEVEGGGWQVGKQLRSDRSSFDREFDLSIPDLLAAASYGMDGNPEIGEMFNGAPGKGLAAGILILSMAIGVVKTDHAVDEER